MALSVTTDLVRIADAETLVGWSNYGAGGSGTEALEPDYFAQGANSISRGVSGNGTVKGACFDIGAGAVLNFNTTHAGKLIYIWMRTSTPGLSDTRALGGIRIIIGSGAVAPGDAAGVWSAWYMDGSDTWIATDGWKCYVLDLSLPPSLTFGGGVDLTAARWFGGVQRTTSTAKGQNFAIDAIYYGFGKLIATGTPTNSENGFLEMAQADFGTIGNRYGITFIKEGIIFVQGKLVIGDLTGSLTTNFSSQNEVLVWNSPNYLSGSVERNTVKSYRPDGNTYFGVDRVASATSVTNMSFGVKVGSGDTASGRSGTSFVGSSVMTRFCTNPEMTVRSGSVNIYGSTFTNLRSGVHMMYSSASAEFLGNSVIKSGTTMPGNTICKNIQWINNNGGSYTYLDDFYNYQLVDVPLASVDSRADWINCVGGTQIHVHVGAYNADLDPAAATRNVVKINADMVGSDNHYVESVIRFESGSNQGTIGILLRGSAVATTENYYFLQCDRPNSMASLIRTDTGTDTVLASSSFAFASDTDYLVHLRASGSFIQGFVNDTSLTASGQTNYQTNRYVGVRGTTNASQVGEPLWFRFGCGPLTDSLGALVYMNANTDIVNCKFINNSRATAFTVSGSHIMSGMLFNGNSVDLLNNSSGSLTINASNGQSPNIIQNIVPASTTVYNPITHTITGLATGSRVVWIRVSDDVELENLVESSGNAIYSYNYTSDTLVDVQILSQDYKNKIIQVTLGSTDATLPASQTNDPFFSNPV